MRRSTVPSWTETFAVRLGWFRLIGMSGGALGALAGGVIATFDLRLNYALSFGTAGGAIAALMLVREPGLHRAPRILPDGRLRHTVSVIVASRGVVRAVVGVALCAALLQALLEFGQFWLLATGGGREWFGLGFAGLLVSAGLGGVIGARLPWGRGGARVCVGGIAVASAAMLSQSTPIAVVIGVQCALAACAAALSVHLTRTMQDGIPSGVRTGVASVAALAGWLTFLPLAALSGWLFQNGGIGPLSVPVAIIAFATYAAASRPEMTSPRRQPRHN